ncbi:MAG: hypothetical protein ING19_01480 [Azospirillum sp.]|nr:hypothetical protein [Azospirillum sp.]
MPEPIADSTEVMFRQVHPNFIDKGVVSSAAFRPTPKDSSKLSVDRSSLVSAELSFKGFKARGWVSAAVYGVSVGEFSAEKIPCLPDPIEASGADPGNGAHAVADYCAHSSSQQQNVAKRLRNKAVARGMLYSEA